MSDSLWPHVLQHARPPCPSPTPGVHPNPCPLSRWCIQPSHLCCPLLLLPSIFPSIRVFSNESAFHIRWPKYWSCSFNISPTSEHPGLISFRMDWLGLLAVQGTLKSLLQHHSSKASILLRSAIFSNRILKFCLFYKIFKEWAFVIWLYCFPFLYFCIYFLYFLLYTSLGLTCYLFPSFLNGLDVSDISYFLNTSI